MKPANLLVIHKDHNLQQILTETLYGDGFQLHFVFPGDAAIMTASRLHPDLILIEDGLAEDGGLEICRLLKKSRRLYTIPVIFIGGENNGEFESSYFEAGGDDYITRPFETNLLIPRLKAHLGHTRSCIGASPLTGLPGSPNVESEIQRRIKNREKFAVTFIDIDYFKSYNDAFGWLAGDDVIRKTAELILNVVNSSISDDCFVGHLGGDDFVVILLPQDAEQFAIKLIEEFDRQVPAFYPGPDQQRGYILQHDRQGNLYCFPLLTISIAICANRQRDLAHPGQVAQIGVELKERLKLRLGSNYLIEN